jgi:hypothetical protein
MKTYTVKFSFRNKGISTEVRAESPEMAKQRILAEVVFHSVEEKNSKLPPEFDKIFSKIR